MSTIIQALTANLATAIDATQVTIPLRNFKDSRGTPIISLPIPSLIYATIEPRSPANQEIISFTGLTDNGNGLVTLTGVVRNLNPRSPYTPLTANVPHANSAEFILSNNPPFYNNFLQPDVAAVITALYQFPEPTLPANAATKNYVDVKDAQNVKITGDQTISAGIKTFNVSTARPKLSSDVDTAVATEFVAYGQLSRQAFAGAANASDTVKGLVEEATLAQFSASTDTGETGARLFVVPSVIQAGIQAGSTVTAIAGESITSADALMVAAGDEQAVVAAFSNTNTVRDSTNGLWYQSFTTGPNTTKIKSISVREDGNGTNGTYTVTLRATPTGANLITPVSITENVIDQIRNFDFGAGVSVSPSTTYYIIMTGLGFKGGTTSSYSGGVSGTSATAGASWSTPATTVTGDFWFRAYEMYTVAGRVYKTSADSDLFPSTAWTTNFIGFAKASAAVTVSVAIQTVNFFSSLSGLTAGLVYYIGNTAGAIASTAGTVSKKIGLALSATSLFIKHDN